MNYEGHVAAARTFLSAAEILSEMDMGMELILSLAGWRISAGGRRALL